MRNSFFSACIILIGVAITALGAYAGSPPTPQVMNLMNLSDAEVLTEKLLSQSAQTVSSDPIVIIHLGDTLPEQLKWIVLRLEQSGVPYRFEQISPAELAASLERGIELTYSNVSTEEPPKRFGERFRSAGQNARLWLRQFFGTSGGIRGLTLWVQVPRSEEIKKADFTRAVSTAAITAVNSGLAFASLYLSNGQAVDWVSTLSAATAISGWTFVNMYWFRQIHELMSQGLAVREVRDPAGKSGVKIDSANPFIWASSFIRSMMSNTLVMAAAFGSEAFTEEALGRSVDNSVINMFARSRITKYILDHTPTQKDKDGKIVVQPGQWSEKKASQINFLWNNGYGLLKGLHLVGMGPAIDFLYLGLAVFNTGWALWDDRAAIESKIRGALKRGAGVSANCDSLFTAPTRILLPNTPL